MNITTTSYLLKENEPLVFDSEARVKWQQIIEKLDLDGQKSLSKAQGSEGNPIPFLWMNARCKAIFGALCPHKEDVSAYSKTPIPLEALSLIALARDQAYFEKISIWYDDRDPDPVAIGTRDKESYLICRWGAEDKSLASLEAMAVERLKADTKRQCEEKIASATDKLSRLDSVVEERLNGGYFYV